MSRPVSGIASEVPDLHPYSQSAAYAGIVTEQPESPSEFEFKPDPASGEPPYQQLRAHIVDAIQQGTLLPGQRLPTVRALAAATGLAANTIASAYRVLEADGVVEGRGRAGTFVTLGALGDEVVRAAALEFVTRIAGLGLKSEQVHGYIDEAVRALRDSATS